MARIAGVNSPTNKHVGIALTHIFGIGRNRALSVCKAAGVASTTQVKDLTEPEITRLREVIAKFPVEGDLMGKKLGVEVKNSYLAMGAYDVILTAEADSDEAMAKWVLSLASKGNVKTTTIKVFPEAEMDKILAALG